MTAVDPTTPPAPLRLGIGLTIGAWLAGRYVVGWHVLNRFSSPLPFHPSLWRHWDAYNYIGLAQGGYAFSRCRSTDLFAKYTHMRWCGNVQWLPGYSWAIAGLHHLGASYAAAGLLVSWVALAVALFLLWWGWLRHDPPLNAFAVLVLLAVFPGAVFAYAIFPMALTLALLLGALLAAARDRLFVMALLMTAAGLCYPDAWAADLGLTLGLVVTALPRHRPVLSRVAWGLAGLLSVAIVGVIDLVAVGRANAYFLMVREQTPPSLWAALQETVDLVFRQQSVEQSRVGSRTATALAISVQAGVAFALAAGAAVTALVRRLEKELVLPATTGAGVLAGVMLSGTVSAWTRSILVAAPCVVCLRRLRPLLLLPLVSGLCILTAVVSGAFFTGRLV